MARKTPVTKSKDKPQPEPAQLKAIERLLEARDYREAVGRARTLLRRFPDYGGLHRMLVEALEQAEGGHAAGLAAFVWAERRPKSLLAQETLFHFAKARGHLMLAERAACRVRELGGETPGFPLDPALMEAMLALPDGGRASAEAMEHFDIGKLHLEGQDFAGALRWLEGLEPQPARNNRALALFHLGQTQEALDAFLATWQVDTDNLFALGWAVRLRLYRGDETGAAGLCTPLAAASARRMEDALLQLDALLLLQQDGLAWEAFERASRSDWFDLAGGVDGATLHHYGACAACRLKRVEDAKRLWQEALALGRKFALAQANLDLFSRDGTPPSFPVVSDFHQALPMTWTASLRPSNEDAAAALRALTASNAYLKAIYVGGDGTFRQLIGFVLKHRAEHSDADAVGLLGQLARLPLGTKEERFGYLSFLRTRGLIGRDEPVTYWDGERLREVKIIGTEIYREPAESDLPPDLDALLGEAVTLFNERNPAESEARLQVILERIPDHPVALGNLAAVRSLQGRHAEARRLLREVVAKHPDYLFARCNLARILIEEGELDDAEQLLKGLGERERLHIQEAFAVYGATAMLSTVRGEHEAARSLLASLERMVEDEDDERRMAQVKRAVARLDPVERFKQVLGAVLKSPPRPSKRRR